MLATPSRWDACLYCLQLRHSVVVAGGEHGLGVVEPAMAKHNTGKNKRKQHGASRQEASQDEVETPQTGLPEESRPNGVGVLADAAAQVQSAELAKSSPGDGNLPEEQVGEAQTVGGCGLRLLVGCVRVSAMVDASTDILVRGQDLAEEDEEVDKEADEDGHVDTTKGSRAGGSVTSSTRSETHNREPPLSLACTCPTNLPRPPRTATSTSPVANRLPLSTHRPGWMFHRFSVTRGTGYLGKAPPVATKGGFLRLREFR